jgi:signal transduction histidine kinase/ligand-binding sensor domain-containing protein
MISDRSSSHSSLLIKVNLLSIGLLFLTVPLELRAQYHVETWTTATGLPQNTIYSILQTRDGYIWFTTLDGLVQYDGVRFKIYNRENGAGGINSNRFTSLYESADGTLWAGTEDGGLTRYRDRTFKTYTVNDGLPHNGVWAMRDDGSGGLIVSTNTGPARLHGERFETVNGEAGVRLPRCIDLSANGACWYQDPAGMHRSFNGETRSYPMPHSLIGLEVVRVFEDRDGAAWISARYGGIAVIRKDGSVVSFNKQANPPTLPITAVSQDRQGQMFFGTAGGGLWSFDGHSFVKQLDASDRLGSDDVRTIFADREGTLWLGRRAAGLAKLGRQIVSVRTKADGLIGDNVYPVLEDGKGNIWVGVWEDRLCVSSGLGRMFAGRADIPIISATALEEDRDGRLWVGAYSGQVGFLKDNRWTEITGQLGKRLFPVFVIKQSADGSIWIGTRTGLCRYRNGETTRFTVSDGLPSDEVRDILEDHQGRLWFATFAGLSRREGDRFINLTEANGLSSNHVRTLYEDSDGSLWIGTYDGGLNRLRDQRITRYTTADGLFSNGVFRIIEDNRARFWISSNRGIFQLNKAELNDFAEGRIKSVSSVAYGLADGLINTECNGGQQPAGWKTREGYILLPTQGGLAVIKPETILQNPLPPPVVIESSSLDGRPAQFAAPIRVGPGQQNLEINYTGLSFVKPEQVRFKYKLEGLNDDWIEAGSRRTAYYAYLPAGSYTFRVLAANSDGLWNTTGAGITVIVTPPFYRTRWFYALVSLGLFGLAFSVYETRLRRLRRAHASQRAFSQQLIELQEAERKRIAAGLHDSLGQNLLIIKNRALIGLQTPDASAHDQLQEISNISSQTLDEVREISYALHPYQMDRLGLTKALHSMIRKVAAACDIEFCSEIDNVDHLFSKESEISIYRIIQESLNNIVKHSGAKNARVVVKNENHTVEISITDDGKGFIAEVSPAKVPGLGLASISERAHMLGGKQTIHSVPGKGTTITLRLQTMENRNGR